MLIVRCALAGLVAFVLWLPAWWAAGRLQSPRLSPFFRALVAIGAATVAWLSILNLVGRLVEDVSVARVVWLALNALACAWLLLRRREELALATLALSWRSWLPVVLLAVLCGAPQWLFAVSTPYWDEVASSSIHTTAPNQFAEGLFPPRHNSFPDIPIKYHYAVTMLVGTVVWLTGLSPNVSIDLVSTGLHLFAFLFVFHWLAQIGLRRLACFAGSFSVLLGGGLSWLYVPWLETYSGFPKEGTPGALKHHHQPALGFWENLIDAGRDAVLHLRNPDGSNSNLPWDIASQFQQHAVALGIALTIFSAWVFCTWIGRPRFSGWLFTGSAAAFGILFLAHGMFGVVGFATAGLWLAVRWFQRPTRGGFAQGLGFGVAVVALAFAHGGFLARGDMYGHSAANLVRRTTLGYSAGGFIGFINWNLAGFGLLLFLALAALAAWPRWRTLATQPRRHVIAFFALMLLVSYLPPQLLFYAYGGEAIEEYTEVAKFFFATHLALGMLTAFAVLLPVRPLSLWLAAPAFAAVAVLPLVQIYAGAFNREHQWIGFYRSPYQGAHLTGVLAMAETLREHKKTRRDTYFDTAWLEETRASYLDELQIFSGSVFSITPRRYELTGNYMISEERVARRSLESGRMARLAPGAEADARCNWYYARPSLDFIRMPAIVRSRFDKLVAQGTYVEAGRYGQRVLYRIAGSSAGLDDGIEHYYRPRIVAQIARPKAVLEDDALAFYDRRQQLVSSGRERIELPPQLKGEFAQLLIGTFRTGGPLEVAAARMGDSEYSRGESMDEMADFRPWRWSQYDAQAGRWSPEVMRWNWDRDVPLLADLDGNGAQELIAWERGGGSWRHENGVLAGTALKGSATALPFAGRFLSGAPVTLGVYETSSGAGTLLAVANAPRKPAVRSRTSFRLQAQERDILVPGDYDGDGLDEIALYRPAEATWLRHDVKGSPLSSWHFGSRTAIPVPADYDGDGALDLAYWEPAAREIHVSLDHGQTVARVVRVPSDALPAFVNMY